MKLLIKLTFLILIGSGLFAINGQAAYSHDELTECECATPPKNGTNPIGTIIRAQGIVYHTSANGYVKAKPGKNLFDGSEVSTGIYGTADISIGLNCNIHMERNQLITISQWHGTSGNLCVTIEQLQVPGNRGPVDLSAIPPMVGIGALPLLLGGGENSASD